jgi:RNA polymerase sigma-70 factor, ECF subfamily
MEYTALFDALYREQYRVVHAYLLGQCGQAEVATDLLQETFLRVWKHIAEVRQVPAERRRFYLLGVARNLMLDERRKRTVRERYLANLSDEPPQNSDPAGVVIARETATAVDNAIRDLPPDLRTVLSLTTLAEMNSTEIGKLLEIPAGTVRYRLLRARRCLAVQLGIEEAK